MSDDIVVEPLDRHDEARVRPFIESLDSRDRTFLQAGALEPGVIAGWISDAGATGDRRFVARTGDAIVGCLFVLPGHDWSAHVAEIRIVVDPAHRRHGVATRLARHAVVTAASSGITKLIVNVIADQAATTAMFTALGFEAEGLLRNQVSGPGGEAHDLLVLAHFVDELVESMITAGFGDVLSE